jgi:nucleoid-associated protein YgaU
MESMLPVPAPGDGATRTHRIVDGDTLGALAQRYLGSASRAGEIFAANRDVLFDPQLLPIGVILKIPPRQRP